MVQMQQNIGTKRPWKQDRRDGFETSLKDFYVVKAKLVEIGLKRICV